MQENLNQGASADASEATSDNCEFSIEVSNGLGTARVRYNGPSKQLFNGGLHQTAAAVGGNLFPQPPSYSHPAFQPEAQRMLPGEPTQNQAPRPPTPPRMQPQAEDIVIDAIELPSIPVPSRPMPIALFLLGCFCLPVLLMVAFNPLVRQNFMNLFGGKPVDNRSAPSSQQPPPVPSQAGGRP